MCIKHSWIELEQGGEKNLKRGVVFLGREAAVFLELRAEFGRLSVEFPFPLLRIADVFFPGEIDEDNVIKTAATWSRPLHIALSARSISPHYPPHNVQAHNADCTIGKKNYKSPAVSHRKQRLRASFARYIREKESSITPIIPLSTCRRK